MSNTCRLHEYKCVLSKNKVNIMDINQLKARQMQTRQTTSAAQSKNNQNTSAYNTQSSHANSAADKCAYKAGELNSNNNLIEDCNKQAMAIIANASTIDGQILLSNSRISEIDSTISSSTRQMTSIQSNYDSTLGSFDSQMAQLRNNQTQQVPVMENGVQKVDGNGNPVFKSVTNDNSAQIADVQKQKDAFVSQNKTKVDDQIKALKEQIDTLRAERTKEIENNKGLLTSYNQALSDILLNQTSSQSLKGLNIIISAALKEADDKYEKEEKKLDTAETKLKSSEEQLATAKAEEELVGSELAVAESKKKPEKEKRPLDLTM